MPFGMQLVHDLLINLHSNNHHLISRCCHGNKTKNPRWPPMAAILDFRFLKFCLILVIFIQKIESLTANSIFNQLVWWRHQCWRHSISVKRCLHYRGTVVQKRLTIGRGVKILYQKKPGAQKLRTFYSSRPAYVHSTSSLTSSGSARFSRVALKTL